MKKGVVDILALVMGLLLTACGASKKASVHADTDAKAVDVIKNHQTAEPDFKSLQARLRGSYKTDDEDQSIGVSLRMQKDSIIWLSAKLAGIIPLAKVKITPEKVQYYEKINGTYFDGDFSLLSKWLGTDLDFEKVQNLLIGQSIYNLNEEAYSLKNATGGYQLSSKGAADLTKFFLIDIQHYRANAQQLVRKAQQQSVTITYPEYEQIEGYFFPKEIQVIVNELTKNTQVNISYKSVEFNTSVSFPFEIPSDYEEITIE